MPEQECASKQPRAGEITHACTASRACPYKYASVKSVWLLWYLHLAHWAFSSRGILAPLLESFGSPIWPHRTGVHWVVTRGESRRKSRGCETMHSWAQFPVRGMTDIAVGRGCVLVGCGDALCRVPETIVQCARV